MSPGVRWRSRRALESPALRRVRLPLLLSLRRRCRRVKGALGLGLGLEAGPAAPATITRTYLRDDGEKLV